MCVPNLPWLATEQAMVDQTAESLLEVKVACPDGRGGWRLGTVAGVGPGGFAMVRCADGSVWPYQPTAIRPYD